MPAFLLATALVAGGFTHAICVEPCASDKIAVQQMDSAAEHLDHTQKEMPLEQGLKCSAPCAHNTVYMLNDPAGPLNFICISGFYLPDRKIPDDSWEFVDPGIPKTLYS